MTDNRPVTARATSAILRTWGVLRLPVLFALAYWQRDGVLEVLERMVGLAAPLLVAIQLLATPLTRFMCFILLMLALAACWWPLRRRRSESAYPVFLTAASAVLIGFGALVGTNARQMAVVLATNFFPGSWLLTLVGARGLRVLLGAGIGIAEIGFLPAYVAWLRSPIGNRSPRHAGRWSARACLGCDDMRSKAITSGRTRRSTPRRLRAFPMTRHGAKSTCTTAGATGSCTSIAT